MEIVAKTPKRLYDARQDSLTLCNWVPRLLIIFSNISSPARVGKGTLRVPLGQRVANGGIDKELFSSRRNGEDVHDGIFGVLDFKGVGVVVISLVAGDEREANSGMGTSL